MKVGPHAKLFCMFPGRPAPLPSVQKLTAVCGGWQQCPSGTKKIYVYRDLNDALWSMFPFMTSFLGLVNQVTAEV